ncbi:hypothetical protein CEK28_07935 [Xenophilus sp. AP218F]|nr:hypothetical protein CEK28_07935 [Xenophilus sp. AP218F]
MTKFLIVDDHAAQRFLISDLLRQIGFQEVEEAGCASGALDVIRQNESSPFDVVICDLQMPNMDGIAFARALGECGAKPSALVFMSSFDSRIMQAAEAAAQASRWKVLGSLQKPVSREALRQVLTSEAVVEALSLPLPGGVDLGLDEIRRCLRERRFEPYYQPKFHLENVGCVGVELLARCRHPQYGLLAPSAFQRLFADPEALWQLTQQLLSQGLGDLRHWRSQGRRISLAFNLGWQLLKQKECTAFLVAETARRRLDPADIIVEVTESEALTELGLALGNMASLRLHGFQLALDDFGSGYANLQLLSQMPLTQLKLDQGLLRAANRGNDGLTVLAAAVGLARSLALSDVVLEGIESELDLDIARQLGVATGQGYFLARPMSAADFGVRF